MRTLTAVWEMHGDTGAGWWVLMVVAMMLFWGVVIGLVVWLVRGGLTRNDQAAGPPAQSPLELLDQRLASGDVSPEDYERRREILSGRSPGDGGAAGA